MRPVQTDCLHFHTSLPEIKYWVRTEVHPDTAQLSDGSS
jgi:hypothetical protein